MPSYGYIQWGECGTIINPQMTVDYLTNLGPQSEFPMAVQAVADPCLAAYRKPDGSITRFISPETDPAPWYSPFMGDDVLNNPSAQFLGVIISEIEGLDSTADRAISQRAVGVGGGSFGPMRSKHRELRFKGTLYATSCRGMDFGMSWLTQTLRGRSCGDGGNGDLCTLEVWTGCPDIVSTGIDTQDGRWQFRDVGLISGPTYSGGPFPGGRGNDSVSCYVREVEWVMASEQPYRYKCPYDALPDTAMSVPISGTVPILTWLTDQVQAHVAATPASPVGEDSLVIELTAGATPLDVEIEGWVNAFADRGCRGIEVPKLTNHNDLNPWLYVVASNGTWNRYDVNTDGGLLTGTATAGSGPIRGVSAAADVSDPNLHRDIIVQFSTINGAGSAPATGGLVIEGFHDLKLVGGTFNAGYSSKIGRAVVVANWSGIAYIDGLLISGSFTRGLSLGSKFRSGVARLRNVRIDGAAGASGWGVSVFDPLFSLYVDGMTIQTSGFGFEFSPKTNDLNVMSGSGATNYPTVQDVVLHNVNVRGGLTAVSSAHATDTDRRSQIRLSNCWHTGSGTLSQSLSSTTVTPSSSAAVALGSDVNGRSFAYFSNELASGVYGRIYVGLNPPVGDFVPSSMAGSGYTFFEPVGAETCAQYIVSNLPPGFKLTIDAATQQMWVRDTTGAVKDGSPYVSAPDGKAYGWLTFDCDPVCVRVVQPFGKSGDGARVKIQQIHREW